MSELKKANNYKSEINKTDDEEANYLSRSSANFSKNKKKITKEDLIKDYKEFEHREQMVFINNYNYNDIKEILTNLSTHQVSNVKLLTKKGIEDGVSEYLNKNNETSLYTCDLSDFFYDNTIETKINEEITKLNSGLNHIDVYSKKIKQEYAGFVRNESLDRFNEQHKK